MTSDKTILVIDDESFFRGILKDALAENYRIIEGSNGEEAISLARREDPDLIIMDVEMPVKNGIEACQILKKDFDTRRIPIILFTSRLDKEDVILGLKAGADDYIAKSASLPEIVARVDAHLRSSDYFSELEHKDLLLLLELSEKIFATRNPMTILRIIVEKMSDVFDVARCSFVGLNDQGELVVKASNDLDAGEEIQIDLQKYPEIKKALETKRPVYVDSIKDDPLMNPVRKEVEGLGYNSIIVVPVIKKESLIGTFFLRTASVSTGGLGQRVGKLCQLVANMSANALENAILFESLKKAQEYFEEMSIRDGLTKLYNHRHFYNRLNHEFSRADRYAAPLSLVFFDIDDFKSINDAHGHTDGDIVLKKVGHIIKSVIRQSDVGARYGGDEFVVLLPNTAAEGALEMANRLHAAIREHHFESLNGAGITISVGVSTFVDKNISSGEQLVSLADEAMYKAKSGGKDDIFQV
ncbi:MAG: diguanylate cyclase [Desulfuromonadales bacterium]|nr:diguanylate cyclase [Desulfuromonadales bacterium]